MSIEAATKAVQQAERRKNCALGMGIVLGLALLALGTTSLLLERYKVFPGRDLTSKGIVAVSVGGVLLIGGLFAHKHYDRALRIARTDLVFAETTPVA